MVHRHLFHFRDRQNIQKCIEIVNPYVWLPLQSYRALVNFISILTAKGLHDSVTTQLSLQGNIDQTATTRTLLVIVVVIRRECILRLVHSILSSLDSIVLVHARGLVLTMKVSFPRRNHRYKTWGRVLTWMRRSASTPAKPAINSFASASVQRNQNQNNRVKFQTE